MVSLLLSTSLLVSAGPKQKKVDNWIDASVKQKSELRASLVKANMPIMSAWIKAKQKAVPMSADLTGQDQLVLVTAAGPDGTDWDWGTWAKRYSRHYCVWRFFRRGEMSYRLPQYR